MSIQKYKNCGIKFRYKNLLKVLLDNPLKCENCGAPHELEISSRVIQTLLLLWPMFIKSIIQKIFPTLILQISSYFIYAIIISLLSPYIFRYRLKDSLNAN